MRCIWQFAAIVLLIGAPSSPTAAQTVGPGLGALYGTEKVHADACGRQTRRGVLFGFAIDATGNFAWSAIDGTMTPLGESGRLFTVTPLVASEPFLDARVLPGVEALCTTGTTQLSVIESVLRVKINKRETAAVARWWVEFSYFHGEPHIGSLKGRYNGTWTPTPIP